MSTVVVTGSFDDLRFRDVRFLHEASSTGELHVLLWSDETVRTLEGKEPRFPQEERLYFLQSLRYVDDVTLLTCHGKTDALRFIEELKPDFWVVDEANDNNHNQSFCENRGIGYRVLTQGDDTGCPPQIDDVPESSSSRPKVVVTGCYDWLHSGHVRFFEEASELGDLYVVVGNDANLRLLKGAGHPMIPQEERRYMVQSIRYVRQALIASGYGWMDAEQEIATIKPDIYLVNEDGDRPEKGVFCQTHGLQYVVLKRLPKPGLPRRQSTELRGF